LKLSPINKVTNRIRIEQHCLGQRSISRPWWRSIGDGLALILDISNIARSSIQNIVGDNLGAAIGKGNSVLAVGGVSIAVLVVSILGISVDGISLNTISKVVCWWGVRVDWERSRSVSWDWSGSIDWGRSRSNPDNGGRSWDEWDSNGSGCDPNNRGWGKWDEGSRGKRDGSAEKREGSRLSDWGRLGSNRGFFNGGSLGGVGVSVGVVTIGDGHSNKTSENDEGLKTGKMQVLEWCGLSDVDREL